jgi:hypothetical protein
VRELYELLGCDYEVPSDWFRRSVWIFIRWLPRCLQNVSIKPTITCLIVENSGGYRLKIANNASSGTETSAPKAPCRHFFLHNFRHTFATEHLRHGIAIGADLVGSSGQRIDHGVFQVSAIQVCSSNHALWSCTSSLVADLVNAKARTGGNCRRRESLKGSGCPHPGGDGRRDRRADRHRGLWP